MMENSYLDLVLFLVAFFAGMAFAALLLCTAALLGEMVSRYFGRWRKWAVYPITVLALLALTYTLFGVMIALPQEGVIPSWVGGCIGVALLICGLALGLWGVSGPSDP